MTVINPQHVLPRTITWLVVASVAINVVLAAAFVIVALVLSNAIHASQLQSCHDANKTRIQDIAIWDRLLRVHGPTSESVRAEIDRLEYLVRVKDTPVDCAALYHVPL